MAYIVPQNITIPKLKNFNGLRRTTDGMLYLTTIDREKSTEEITVSKYYEEGKSEPFNIILFVVTFPAVVAPCNVTEPAPPISLIMLPLLFTYILPSVTFTAISPISKLDAKGIDKATSERFGLITVVIINYFLKIFFNLSTNL